MLEYVTSEPDRMDEDEIQEILDEFEKGVEVHEDMMFVLISKRRLKVVCSLSKGSLTQKHICRTTGIRYAHIGRVLDGMIKWGLVECKTPRLRKFKTYDLTATGRAVHQILVALVWTRLPTSSVTVLQRQIYIQLKEVLDESSEASGFGPWQERAVGQPSA